MPLEDTAAGNPAETTAPDTSATDASTPAPSMDDTLAAAYDAAMARSQAGEEGAEEPTEPAQGRQRAPDGKFLPAKTKANGAAESPAPTGEEVKAAETPAQPKPSDVAPNTWRKEVAGEFSKLPEPIKAEIHKREEDFHRGIEQYKEAANFGTVMAQELMPYQETMAKFNVNARDVVKSLANSWNMLITGSPQQKTGLVLQLIKDYGIDLSSAGQAPPQGQAQPTQEDPRLVAALQRLDQIEGNLTAQERQRAEAEYATHADAVTKFGADPKNGHFSAVKAEMAALLNAGQASDLSDAYDKAIWINPGVRTALLAEQEKERADKAAKDAAAAKKAAGANVIRRGTPPVTRKTGRIEDTLERRYDELMS